MKNASNIDSVVSSNALENPKSKRAFIKLDFAIKDAKALTRTTISLYEAILWFQRYKDNCFPGYEKLKAKAKIKSKTTLSLHLKILVKVGLVKKIRRGKMQSNIYMAHSADTLTSQILKNLSRPYKYIIEEITKDDEKARKIKAAKREVINAAKRRKVERRKVLNRQTYPQQSEVQLLDSNKALRALNIYSSNLNNDSKEIKEEKRGGEFTHIGEYIKTKPSFQSIAREAGSRLAKAKLLREGKIYVATSTPPKKPMQGFREGSRLEAVMTKLSLDIGDSLHTRENVQQVKNIFAALAKKDVDEIYFTESLMHVAGMTKEIRSVLKRPGAYFFSLLRDKWKAYL